MGSSPGKKIGTQAGRAGVPAPLEEMAVSGRRPPVYLMRWREANVNPGRWHAS